MFHVLFFNGAIGVPCPFASISVRVFALGVLLWVLFEKKKVPLNT